jgi:diguanylate cyclase (GGDEF)-like protein
MSLVTTDRLTSAEANVAQIQSGADNYVTWFYLFLLLLINVTLIFQVVNSHIETIARMARTDTLTKVATRAVLEEKMEQERLRMTRTKKEYSLIFLDIDHFKSVNDTLGHNGGDAALKFVAQILKSTVRRSDLVGRWGGEEFLIVLPETDSAKAFQVAEKARLALMATPMIWKGEAVLLTASFGVSVCLEKDSGISDIVSRADAAMYVAKETGRNRCVNAEEGTKET